QRACASREIMRFGLGWMKGRVPMAERAGGSSGCEALGEPPAVDLSLVTLVGPASAVVHGQRHEEGVVLPGTVARERELLVAPVDEGDAPAGGLDVLEAELPGEELRVDVHRVARRGVEVEVVLTEAGLLEHGADVAGPGAGEHREVLDLP